MYAMLVQSPSATLSPLRGLTFFSTGTLSPVSAASSILRLADIVRRISAGTESPASSTTRSPGTSSLLLIVSCLPSRMTLLVDAVISCSAAMAFSALLSCTTPMTALSTTTTAMMMTSAMPSPPSIIAMTRLTMAAAIRITIIGSAI